MRILVLLLVARNERIRLQENCKNTRIQNFNKILCLLNHCQRHRWQIYHRVIDTFGSPWLANISKNLKTIWNGPNVIFRCLREDDTWKKTWSKKSRDTVPVNHEDWGGSFWDERGYWIVFLNIPLLYIYILWLNFSWDLDEIQLLPVVLEVGLKETQPLTLKPRLLWKVSRWFQKSRGRGGIWV